MNGPLVTRQTEPGGHTAMTVAERFEQERPLLFAIAYRMLGSVMEAEDVVQEAWLRYQATPADSVRSPKAFLSTVVTRLCLDQLKSARARREQYFGPWLPEPLLTSEDASPTPEGRVDVHESVSMAFLVLLESLTPVERAVFLLREVFDYGYDEIAAIVDRSEDACRQSFHRAKQSLVARRPRFQASPEARQRLTQGFLRAVEAGDLPGLTELLAEDITLWTDGGGKTRAAVRPLHGPETVARFILGVVRKAPPNIEVEVTEVNGDPGLLLRVDGAPFAAMAMELDEHCIHAIRTIVNPDKLAHLA
jgi:RNA polymerase sigma-70 factor (ECF subfamily)